MTPFIKIIRNYKLDNYLKVLIENNKANNLPYHNFFHTLCVMLNCFLISANLNLEYEQIRTILIAALFHDFNHSGGKLKDTENVKIAIKSFLENSEEDKKTNDSIVDIIRATEYPYVIEEKDLTQAQKIIRDADLMQTFQKNYLQQNWIGLASEMNLDLLKALEGSMKFWENIKFHTVFAKTMAEKIMPSRFEDVKYLIDLLKK